MSLAFTLRQSIKSFAALPFCIELRKKGQEAYTYEQLYLHAEALAARFSKFSSAAPTIAIFGSRSYRSYLAAVAAVLARRPFICINPAWPVARAEKVLSAVRASLLVIPDDQFAIAAGKIRAVGLDRIELSTLNQMSPCKFFQTNGSALPCYFVATSGSTGEPKIIPINAKNLEAYLEVAPERGFLSPGIRISQTFDLSFDPGIGDLFNALLSGACLLPVSDSHRANLLDYFQRARISYWNSAPSLLGQAFSVGQLDEFFSNNDIRQMSFIGEALSQSLARKVHRAFPSAEVWNQYGPAEATIAVSAYQWKENLDWPVVPIGRPFSGVRCALLDDGTVRQVEERTRGELLLAGPQVFSGYHNGIGASAFIRYAGELWFRTRDLVEAGTGGELRFLGRTDYSFKVAGHRIEPHEVETIFLSVPGVTGVIHAPGQESLEGFPQTSILLLEGTPDPAALHEAVERCRNELPAAQVPRDFFLFSTFPLNPNLKADRSALLHLVIGEDGAAYRINL